MGAILGGDPDHFGDFGRSSDRALKGGLIAGQFHHCSHRFTISLGAKGFEITDRGGDQVDSQLLFDFADQGGFVTFPRFALTTREIVGRFALRAGAEQLFVLNIDPGQFVDLWHDRFPLR